MEFTADGVEDGLGAGGDLRAARRTNAVLPMDPGRLVDRIGF